MHGDKERKARYLSRHAAREEWTKRGADTAGFWARWLLRNKSLLEASAKDIKRRFGFQVKLSILQPKPDTCLVDKWELQWCFEDLMVLLPVLERSIAKIMPLGMLTFQD